MKTIILNHKSYMSYNDIVKYKDLLEKIKTKNDLVLFPSIPYLSLFKNSKLKIGSQNFYSYNYGSYTGEICLESLKSLNINYTLIGHPERLMLGLDRYIDISDKLFRSLNMNFNTILCIGSTERLKTIKKELKYYLKRIDESAAKNLTIAYEPTSKIEGEEVDINDILEVKNLVKKYTYKKYELDIPFIYGGSITKDNISTVLDITDGVIIGKSSTDINTIKELLKDL